MNIVLFLLSNMLTFRGGKLFKTKDYILFTSVYSRPNTFF
jgi:hypothetical protein